MKLEQLHHRLVTLSEQVAELHTVLVAEMPQDEEGLMIHDGSDLADALKCLTQLDSCLTRLAFKLAREGVE